MSTFISRCYRGSIAVVLTLASTHLYANNLTITVHGIDKKSGTLQVAIFDSEKAYSKVDHQKAYASYAIAVKSDESKVTFHDLPNNSYAISLFHDENNNGVIDTSSTGVPIEGYGISNLANKYQTLTFSEASFPVNKKNKTIDIKMHYLKGKK